MAIRTCISNVYTDANRGGALLTIAAARAARAAFGSDQAITLLSNAERFDPQDYAFTMKSLPGVRLQGHPLDLGGGRVARARSHGAALAAVLTRGRVPVAGLGLGFDDLVQADVLVGKGGQLFRDFPTMRSLMGFWASAYPLTYAARVGTPAAVYGVQVGPFTHRPSERAASAVLRRLRLVLARDDRSAEIASGLGASRVDTMPDSVFSLDADDLVGELPSEAASAGRYLVVTPHASMSEGAGTPVLATIADACRDLLRCDLIDSVITVYQTADKDFADRSAARALAIQLDDPRVAFMGAHLQPDELLALYRGAVACVSGRIHGSVMALLAGTPSLVVDTNNTKGADIFEIAGFARFSIAHDATQTIPTRLREVIESGIEERQAIARQLAVLRTRAERGAAALATII